MKTKILVAMIACLAIAACSKSESTSKEENKAGESTQQQGTGKTEPAPAQPAAPAGGHSSANEAATTLAADETAAQTNNAAAAQDADQKVNEMKQDMTNTSNQIQGANTDAPKAENHSHAED